MVVYLNGRFVAEEKALISIFDRGFIYGDGLMEAIRIYEGNPFLWPEHIQRLQRGAKFLKIPPPVSAEKMRRACDELLKKNRVKNAILRIVLSRGIGPRGYSPRDSKDPSLMMSLHAAPSTATLPKSYRVVISKYILPAGDPLAPFKHCNRLRQIMARDEADRADAHEALLLNDRGFIAEGTTTNIFWFERQTLCTPPLDAGILEGITREYVLRLASALKFKTREKNIRPPQLFNANGIFVTSSGIEVMEVSHLDGKKVNRSPLLAQLRSAYRSPQVSGAL